MYTNLHTDSGVGHTDGFVAYSSLITTQSTKRLAGTGAARSDGTLV